MQKFYKQFAELVTRLKASLRVDEFFVARLRLTFYYSLTAIVILGGSSIILYNTILSNLTRSIAENIFLDTQVSVLIIDRAKEILFNRFLTIDIIIMFFVIILGFLLTYKTLEPIRLNMQKQKRFVADASHELRTPIAVIISGLEVNLSNKKLDLPSAKKVLESTLGEMREFSKLSNNLLDISKYDEQVQKEHEPVAIDELIKSIVEKDKNLALTKNIDIETKITAPAIILGNKMELNRLFFNILDNAIKYTPQGGKISLTDTISSGKYIVTVSDNGIGIKEDIISKIFDPFFRGDPSRSKEGAGLGLTLVKKIVKNHKGTISIKSKEGKGTNVIISLPLSSS